LTPGCGKWADRRTRTVANREGPVRQELLVGHDGELIRTSLTTPSAFAAIFEAHYRAIDAYCVRRLGGEGHDVSAATFTEAFRVRDRFDATRPDARPWLYGIASNLLRHHRRRERSRWRAYARSDAATATTFDVDARLDADQLGGLLAAALRATPVRDRDALLLHAWADLTYEQIGDALGVPIGTVRSRIARARSRLRAALGDAADPDAPADDAPELSGVPDRGDDA
jgi:RNA polymerase sigma-70 factor (ECF subfamily)